MDYKDKYIIDLEKQLKEFKKEVLDLNEAMEGRENAFYKENRIKEGYIYRYNEQLKNNAKLTNELRELKKERNLYQRWVYAYNEKFGELTSDEVYDLLEQRKLRRMQNRKIYVLLQDGIIEMVEPKTEEDLVKTIDSFMKNNNQYLFDVDEKYILKYKQDCSKWNIRGFNNKKTLESFISTPNIIEEYEMIKGNI